MLNVPVRQHGSKESIVSMRRAVVVVVTIVIVGVVGSVMVSVVVEVALVVDVS